MDIQKLRRETQADHQAVEGSIPLMHTGLKIAEYIQCLRRMYGVVAAWEEIATDLAPRWLQPALLARQRKLLIERDFAWFSVAEIDQRRPTLPQMNCLPSLLGTMYVMEGSTLGGQLIARHVERELHLIDGRGCCYFSGFGSQTGPMWKEFCKMLRLKIEDDQTDTVIMSAKAMFSTFGMWMHRNSAVDVS